MEKSGNSDEGIVVEEIKRIERWGERGRKKKHVDNKNREMKREILRNKWKLKSKEVWIGEDLGGKKVEDKVALREKI